MAGTWTVSSLALWHVLPSPALAKAWEFKAVLSYSKAKGSLGYILAPLTDQSSFILLIPEVAKAQTSSSSFHRIPPLLDLTQTLVLWPALLDLDLTTEGNLWETISNSAGLLAQPLGRLKQEHRKAKGLSGL